MYEIGYLLILFSFLYFVRPIKDDPPPVLYENLYLLDTKEVMEETEENNHDKAVEEVTPEGRVIMKWEDGVFLYWSDKPKQYRYLETVARKYVLLYNCKENYIDMREHIQLPPKPKELDPIFARFKTYNSTTNEYLQVEIKVE